MEFIAIKCPSCGANSDCLKDTKRHKCQFCDTVFVPAETQLQQNAFINVTHQPAKKEGVAIFVISAVGFVIIIIIMINVFNATSPSNSPTASVVREWTWETIPPTPRPISTPTPTPTPSPAPTPTPNPAANDPDYILPFRGNPSDFIRDLDTQLNAAYFHGNFASALGILEIALPHIEFDNANEHNVLFNILERITRNEDFDSLTLLANNGLDLNLRDRDGHTVLSRNTPSLTFLSAMVELGADPNQRSVNNWESALTRAIKNRGAEQALFLIQAGDPELVHRPDLAGGTPFHLAVGHGLFDIAEALLDTGFDINTSGSAVHSRFSVQNPFYGRTALMVAAEAVDVEAVGFLLESGANPLSEPNIIHSVVGARETASMSIPQRTQWQTNQIEVIGLLIAAGSDIDERTIHGATPLMALANMPNFINERLLEALIQSGADPSARNNAGMTPLHYAASWGNMTVARFLIMNGAYVNARDNNDNTPLTIARQRNNSALVGLLLSVDASE